ncbi:unnamed protein product [Vitrella brassicaformis CCMP3155]|uniref:Uncharacterized protein n=3 Tax=Vitrella brassicaformis TaxID=1169539 RepID=A0A0G4GI83_VITBC|nr:unnamed protein product [Vitrella brassicaformis CCMP3155]|eukprot:CEM29296.1 unnamed protein product [Vitrella brassicaformis CCMP3155]
MDLQYDIETPVGHNSESCRREPTQAFSFSDSYVHAARPNVYGNDRLFSNDGSESSDSSGIEMPGTAAPPFGRSNFLPPIRESRAFIEASAVRKQLASLARENRTDDEATRHMVIGDLFSPQPSMAVGHERSGRRTSAVEKLMRRGETHMSDTMAFPAVVGVLSRENTGPLSRMFTSVRRADSDGALEWGHALDDEGTAETTPEQKGSHWPAAPQESAFGTPHMQPAQVNVVQAAFGVPRNITSRRQSDASVLQMQMIKRSPEQQKTSPPTQNQQQGQQQKERKSKNKRKVPLELLLGSPATTSSHSVRRRKEGRRGSHATLMTGEDLQMVPVMLTPQQQPAPPAMTFGNPAAMGSLAFSLSVALNSSLSAGWIEVGKNARGMVASFTLCHSGMGQLLTGMWMFARGNGFGGVVQSSYGLRNISLGLYLILESQISETDASIATEGATALMVVNILWCVVTLGFFMASLGGPRVAQITLGTAALMFAFGAGSRFMVPLKYVSAMFGMCSSVSACYNAMGLLTMEAYPNLFLPGFTPWNCECCRRRRKRSTPGPASSVPLSDLGARSPRRKSPSGGGPDSGFPSPSDECGSPIVNKNDAALSPSSRKIAGVSSQGRQVVEEMRHRATLGSIGSPMSAGSARSIAYKAE